MGMWESDWIHRKQEALNTLRIRSIPAASSRVLCRGILQNGLNRARKMSLFSWLQLLILGAAAVRGRGSTSPSSTTSISSSAATTTTSRTSTGTAPPLPRFVAHVDDTALRRALSMAEDRHARAVQLALDHYPTHKSDEDDGTPTSREQENTAAALLDAVRLREYAIDAPGSLPDFAETIPREVLVTDPPLLSKEECARAVAWAEEHFSQEGGWPVQKSGDYDVAGCWIRDVPHLREWFVRTAQNRLFPLLQRAFPDFVDDPTDLCVDQTYLFRYTPETGGRTGVHTDAGCLSFTIALNSNQEYTGGGTWFEGLQAPNDQSESQGTATPKKNVLEMDVGQVTVRPGGIKHAGHAVESGVRYVIGGFCMNRKKPEPVRMLLTPGSQEEADASQIAALEAALAINPQFIGSYTQLANELKRHGQIDQAQEVLEYCLEHVHPHAGEAAYSLGMMRLDAGDYDRARQCFEVCLRDDPHDTEALMALAQLCNLRGDTVGEDAHYRRILATPGAQAHVQASAYCNLGVLHEQEPEELDFYLKALELRPESFAARFSLASAYAGRQLWGDAVEHFRRAIENSDSSDHTSQALELLYRSAVSLLQTQPNAPRSQQEVVERIRSLMGPENYQLLAASRS